MICFTDTTYIGYMVHEINVGMLIEVNILTAVLYMLQ